MESLSNHFKGVAAKLLSEVEINPSKSNQHEFNGINELKRLLGSSRRHIDCMCIFIATDEDHRLSQHHQMTWYDSRENHPTRSEHRLYYPATLEPLKAAAAGDTLIFGLRPDDSLLVLIIPQNSPQRDELLWLFGIGAELNQRLQIFDPASIQLPIALLSYIAEEASIPISEMANSHQNWADLVTDRFGLKFPTTRALSSLARETLGNDLSAQEEPDIALMKLMDREEELFRCLERRIVSRHLEDNAAGWSEDVDAFISFSLSVQNRRKSRAGHALENHLEWLFKENNLRYARGAKTENNSRPDFLFPGVDEYHSENFPVTKLNMLGVKTTCKDRWRQILSEAHRIERKHLLTLQPKISQNQLREIGSANVQLVIPSPISQTEPSAIGLLEFIKQMELTQGH